MTFALVRQEKADRARGDSTTTTPPQHRGSVAFAPGPRHVTKRPPRALPVTSVDRARRALGRSIDRSFPSMMIRFHPDGVPRSHSSRDIDALEGGKFFCPRGEKKDSRGSSTVRDPRNPPQETCFGKRARADVANPTSGIPGETRVG